MGVKEKEDSSSSEESKKKKKKDKKWVNFLKMSLKHTRIQLSHESAGTAVHITSAGAEAAKTAAPIGGEGLAAIGQAAPVLQVAAVAFDAYQIGRNVEKDRRRGTTRNTVKKVTTTVATYGGGMGGAFAGAAIGSAFMPGVGTIIGGVVGGLTGGMGGGYGSGKAAEVIMDRAEYDTVRVECVTCHRIFLLRKYANDNKDNDEKNCEQCREH
uniref:Glycine zipper domain-containing protein n=1 Tax=Caenorhabditis japonica TaxID=281687 RepID=A0A8R1DG28_CAEJA